MWIMTTQQTCPVCGLPVTDASGFTAVHDDQTYHFCSQRCRDAFVQDPGSYVGNTGS